MKQICTQTPLARIHELDVETTHHVCHVLRLRKGARMRFVYADEEFANYMLHEVTAGGTSIWHREGDVEKTVAHPPVILAQAFLKGERWEWALQKTTELQVDIVYGIAARHCVARYDAHKLRSKEERWRKIQQEATQQCGRMQVPRYASLPSWDRLCDIVDADYPTAIRLVAYEEEHTVSLKEALAQQRKDIPIILVIGPEGGLAVEEVDVLRARGFSTVRLGQAILRAETAAIVGLTCIQYERERF